MNNRLLTIVLLVGLFFSLAVLVPKLMGLPAPGNQEGYEPIQPIEFSHHLHCTQLEISCLYCHSSAEKSRYAGIPSASVCMNCHKTVTAPWAEIQAEDELAQKEKRKAKRIVSPELQKLYDALGLDEKLEPKKMPTPIKWVRVHNLPDHAYFDHRAHGDAGVVCQKCHGPIEKMERVRQVSSLSMGWCVNCHREMNVTGVAGKKVHASVDCSACHH